jgi:Protein of unknown function (DUF1553)/Protein of unknown function (DUF1549)/Planctomycete cytochrome C
MIRPFLASLLLAIVPSAAFAGDPVEYNRDIRPILSENCFLCHGPDKNHRKAGLRLDDRQSALTKEAIVPGKADASEVITRIFSGDAEEVMPPPESTKTLTPAQKELLKRWIAEGATFQAHWAYEPIKRPAIPEVKDPSWLKNPIDSFILATLEAKGIKPSPEADRRTLLRRLSLDVIGLPPSLEEVRAFEADTSPNAYEKQVDRLLASPRYGERMSVPWLDLARFADTVGYHGDQNQYIFPYRDYVIDAFNRNLPFDRFTLEQLAGDLLPDPTPEQLVATGFNRLNMMTREGGAQPKEYLAKYAGDRVRTVSLTWLGSTMGCAECHDHKYDPFAARDFYRMAAFFADVKQWGVYMDYGYTPNPELKGFSNDHPFPPEIEVESRYLHRRIARIDRQIQALYESLTGSLKTDEFKAWLDETRAFLARNPGGWATPRPSFEPSEGITAEDDASLLIAPGAKLKDGLKVKLEPGPGWIASIRLELMPRPEHDGRITRNGAAGVIVQLAASLIPAEGKTKKLSFFQADSETKDNRYVNGSAIIGIKDGWRTASGTVTFTDIKGRDGRRLSLVNSKQDGIYVLDQPVKLVEGDKIELSVKGEALGCFRLAVSPFGFEEAHGQLVTNGALRLGIDEHHVEKFPKAVAGNYLLGTGFDRSAFQEFHRLELERLECRDGKALSMITQSREPLPTRVLPRGNWQDESGELLTPGVPKFLPQPLEAETRRLNRVDLARWLTSPENPLTARVFSNRLWKQFFGNGLSAVMEDVGAQGDWPSHPDLLDWLASEFREGWDVKALVKRMVMSATYRQDARLRQELRESDPNNRLLSSQNPRRLEAEFIRDNALAIAGLLDNEVGGPSAKPYQPAGYYAILQFPDRDYTPNRDDRQYRRGVYTHWQRTFLQPMLANFDAPGREECIASRVVANTPQQALTLLNDPTFVEAARVLAGLILTSSAPTDGSKIDLLFEKALARPAKPKEKASLLEFLAKERVEAHENPEAAARLLNVGLALNPKVADPLDLAAWTEVCRVVLNLHESITRY